EEIEDPVEARDQHGAEHDEHTAHHDGAENPVEQHAMLAALRNAEELEDENDDEDVVDAERLLDDVAGEERQADFVPVKNEQAGSKQEGESHPDGRPDGGLLRPNLVRLPMKHAEVEGEHREDERDEPHPEPDVRRNHGSRKSTREPWSPLA